MSPFEWGLLIILSVLWGGSFFFNGIAIRELPTLTFVGGRVALGAVILFTIMRLRGFRMPSDKRVWRAFFVMGFLNNVLPFTLIVWGQIHVASGVASILNSTTPLFTVILAHFLTTDEKMTSNRLIGIGVGFIGVVIMIGGDALQGISLNFIALLAVLGAALSYAFAGIYGRRFKAMGVSPMATATGQVTASSIMLMPVVFLIDKPWALVMPSLATFGAIIGVAVLSTVLAYIIYFQLLATAGATNLLLVTFLIPISAILLGIGFLGEVLLTKHIVGMGLISMGLIFIDGRLGGFLRLKF